jgi:hypothetical protein
MRSIYTEKMTKFHLEYSRRTSLEGSASDGSDANQKLHRIHFRSRVRGVIYTVRTMKLILLDGIIEGKIVPWPIKPVWSKLGLRSQVKIDRMSPG